MKKKICVVTTSRADYGLLYWLMKEIREDNKMALQVIAAGMHLEPRFGATYKTIEKDGFRIDARVAMSMKEDTPTGVSRSIGIGCAKFSQAYRVLKPDLVVLSGDRYELFSAAVTAVIAKIPIAHIHGGETTEGAIDEIIRNSITKMSSIHFASTDIYKRKIIQMGENSKCVFNYGAPGLDNLYRLKLLSKGELEKALNFDLDNKVAVVTYHPATLDNCISTSDQVKNLLAAIDRSKLKALFTAANADVGNRLINTRIERFCKGSPKRYKYIKSLGQILYLSCLRNFDLMIGNSSSGIIESPSFGIPAVNIGNRQKGRVRAANVIDVGYSEKEIRDGIETAMNYNFKRGLKAIINPYDKYQDGRASYQIKEAIKRVKLNPELLMTKKI